MAAFSWQALDKAGSLKKGVREADSPKHLRQILRKQGLNPLAMEEVSKACASCGVIMSVNNSLVCWPLETYADEEQKQKFLAPLARGDKLGAYCLSEPGADIEREVIVRFAPPGGQKLRVHIASSSNRWSSSSVVTPSTLPPNAYSEGA
mgnify:CR=1 FL=1